MNEQHIILTHLLGKYERSKHLHSPGTSPIRVMLRIGKKDLPEYDYEDAVIRDAFNEAARTLEVQRLVQLEWLPGHPVLQTIVLNLDRIAPCYDAVGRVHPRQWADHIRSLIDEALKDVDIPWLSDWKTEVCTSCQSSFRVPLFCKSEDILLKDLLCAFREYAALNGSVTMRAFSNKCFSDTKYFERNVRDQFLRIARTYNKELALACEEHQLGEKEQLAFLGIYARPELYELSGNCTLRTGRGELSLDAAAPYGMALPSTLVDSILEVDLRAIRRVTFIENKTNYDEYILSEKQPDELVIYHGGFLSPHKRVLFARIADASSASVQMRFWADIDAGGFRMFRHLQRIIPDLTPMRMSAAYVDKYHAYGYARPSAYLSALEAAMQNGEHPLFEDAIHAILKYGVTIEQEVFLNSFEPSSPNAQKRL